MKYLDILISSIIVVIMLGFACDHYKIENCEYQVINDKGKKLEKVCVMEMFTDKGNCEQTLPEIREGFILKPTYKQCNKRKGIK